MAEITDFFCVFFLTTVVASVVCWAENLLTSEVNILDETQSYVVRKGDTFFEIMKYQFQQTSSTSSIQAKLSLTQVSLFINNTHLATVSRLILK